jgi:predicted phosphodiesterase
VRLVLMADTHVPVRARDLPAAVWSAVDEADVVFHAGDWVGEGLLDALEGRAARLVGVYGNNDGAGLRARLLNPGSPTDRRRQPVATFMTAEVVGGVLAAVELCAVSR